MEPTQPQHTAYLVQQGIAAARSGRSAEARRLLQQVIQHTPDNEMAWLWLSGLVSTNEQKLACLRHVLRVNPRNVYARAGLTRLESTSLVNALPPADLETRLANVTSGFAAEPKNGKAAPAIKPLKPRNIDPRQEYKTIESTAPPASETMACPACDRPITFNIKFCPHCYMELKSLEEMLARGTRLPPTQPLKPKRRGFFGRLSN